MRAAGARLSLRQGELSAKLTEGIELDFPQDVWII